MERDEREYKSMNNKYIEKKHHLDTKKAALHTELHNKKELTDYKDRLFNEISELKVKVTAFKKQGMEEINERERQKIYAVRKLSKEMDYKVKETQANLMALNDEQLQTTTRLTILQNHQLTTELDY